MQKLRSYYQVCSELLALLEGRWLVGRSGCVGRAGGAGVELGSLLEVVRDTLYPSLGAEAV